MVSDLLSISVHGQTVLKDMPCTARGIEFRPHNLASHGSRLKEPPRRNPTLSGSDMIVWIKSVNLRPYGNSRKVSLIDSPGLQLNQHLFRSMIPPLTEYSHQRTLGLLHTVLRSSYELQASNYSRIIPTDTHVSEHSPGSDN